MNLTKKAQKVGHENVPLIIWSRRLEPIKYCPCSGINLVGGNTCNINISTYLHWKHIKIILQISEE